MPSPTPKTSTFTPHSQFCGYVEVVNKGCVGVSQGPRLETAAEIRRFGQDGCDLIGMTTMPEAALAREAGLDYACISVTSNWAEGLEAKPVTMAAIESTLESAMFMVRKLLAQFFEEISDDR